MPQTPSGSPLRFKFGKNWRSFLSLLNEDRIAVAERSLQDLCQERSLENKDFLDIGSGSGLFSLAAKRLGARVRSFDFDADSVACTQGLKDRYFPADRGWQISAGSVLDISFLRSLGSYDLVYSWGVLHHTGDMYQAFANVIDSVKPNGKLVIAIYNDQGWLSSFWKSVKRRYVASPFSRLLIQLAFIPVFFLSGLGSDITHLRNPLLRYRSARERGMSPFHDWLDWLGGYPFEVASREAVIGYFKENGFTLINLRSAGNKLGCNQFCFVKTKSV